MLIWTPLFLLHISITWITCAPQNGRSDAWKGDQYNWKLPRRNKRRLGHLKIRRFEFSRGCDVARSMMKIDLLSIFGSDQNFLMWWKGTGRSRSHFSNNMVFVIKFCDWPLRTKFTYITRWMTISIIFIYITDINISLILSCYFVLPICDSF